MNGIDPWKPKDVTKTGIIPRIDMSFIVTELLLIKFSVEIYGARTNAIRPITDSFKEKASLL